MRSTGYLSPKKRGETSRILPVGCVLARTALAAMNAGLKSGLQLIRLAKACIQQAINHLEPHKVEIGEIYIELRLRPLF